MRRALRQALPAFAFHFGIKPWEIDDLTYGEVSVFLRALQDINKEG